MKITLGFSPCPNDTFIFDALVNNKIDSGGIEWEVLLEDVQTLNQWALEGRLDITKLSYGVLPLVISDYIVLNSGGALGKGVGPLLISKGSSIDMEQQEALKFAVPGQNTTANLLFSLAYPRAKQKHFMVFSEIEDAVLSGKVDCGVIIHENRFTYQQKGLTCLMDLGSYWEEKTGLPIPLGAIAAKRNMDHSLLKKVDSLIRQSIDYAFRHYPTISNYVVQHSQEMDEQVMRQHIDLYVNDFSIQVGQGGKKAVEKLLEIYSTVNNSPISSLPVFID